MSTVLHLDDWRWWLLLDMDQEEIEFLIDNYPREDTDNMAPRQPHVGLEVSILPARQNEIQAPMPVQ